MDEKQEPKKKIEFSMDTIGIIISIGILVASAILGTIWVRQDDAISFIYSVEEQIEAEQGEQDSEISKVCNAVRSLENEHGRQVKTDCE